MTADGLHVSRWMDVLSGLVERHPRAAIRLGNLESRMLREETEEIGISRPTYVTGLARSGSTVLLELLAQHPAVTTHRYRDFPLLFMPYAWNWFVDRAARRDEVAQERAHRDRIKVTPESPEAFEEVIWMAFFPDLHTEHGSDVLDGSVRNSAFDEFYRDHIRKLLRLRGGERYLSKANYNITRLQYLKSLFPDARFVIPVRDPVWHVASLVKQHNLFCQEGARSPRARRHMRRTGHFEFGLDRRAIVTDAPEATEQINALWRQGREIGGWARYWAMVYGHVIRTLGGDDDLARACRIVRYEDLCADPAGEMTAIADHCDLPALDLPAQAAARIEPPDYYQPSFTPDEEALIRDHTRNVAQRLGYA